MAAIHVDEDDKKMSPQNGTPSIKDSLGRDHHADSRGNEMLKLFSSLKDIPKHLRNMLMMRISKTTKTTVLNLRAA